MDRLQMLQDALNNRNKDERDTLLNYFVGYIASNVPEDAWKKAVSAAAYYEIRTRPQEVRL